MTPALRAALLRSAEAEEAVAAAHDALRRALLDEAHGLDVSERRLDDLATAARGRAATLRANAATT